MGAIKLETYLVNSSNWHTTHYASNAPLDFVDPSGQSAEHAQFIGYMTAGLTDLGHHIKYQAMRAYEGIAGVGATRPSGVGLKGSTGVGSFTTLSTRVGYDSLTGPIAFGEASYNLGSVKGIGQLGYSNGGLRAIGRLEGPYRDATGGASIGTSNDIRGKVKMGPFEVMYNSNLSGRVDFPVGSFYGVDLGGFVNFNLTNESLNHFEQAAQYDDWSYSGMPYGGAAW